MASLAMAEISGSVLITDLLVLEFRNALHLSVFRGELTNEYALLKQELFDQDIANGIYRFVPIASTKLFAETTRLADLHSEKLGTRSLDLMHVASALILGVEVFLSFDKRQRSAAEAEGLRVLP